MNRSTALLSALFAAAAVTACGGSDDKDSNTQVAAATPASPAASTPAAPTPSTDSPASAPSGAASTPDTAASTPDTAASTPDTGASAPDDAASAPDDAASTPDDAASAPDGAASDPVDAPPSATKSTYSTAQLNGCPASMKPAPISSLTCLQGTYFGKLTDATGKLNGDHTCKLQVNADGKMLIAQPLDATNPHYYETEVYMPTTETADSYTEFKSTGTAAAPSYTYYFINQTPPHQDKPIPNEFTFKVQRTAAGWSMFATLKNEYASNGCLAEISGTPTP